MTIIKNILPITLFIFFIFGCSEPMIKVKDGDDNQIVKAKANKNFAIQLESRLSTGFSWKLMEYPKDISIVQENVKTEESNKVGGTDIQEFILKSAAKGEFTITFQYGEHWKKNPQYVKTSKIKVIIE
ncbi:MAG: protease inhibitor I42 family protein [Leptospirales bacterium]|nr:protease inhibitor I42 family protein [Leptospirales bacterium]